MACITACRNISCNLNKVKSWMSTPFSSSTLKKVSNVACQFFSTSLHLAFMPLFMTMDLFSLLSREPAYWTFEGLLEVGNLKSIKVYFAFCSIFNDLKNLDQAYLGLASSKNNLDVLEYMLSIGVGGTPRHFLICNAICGNNIREVDLLLTHNASLDWGDNGHRKSALELAINVFRDSGDIRMVRFLIDKGAPMPLQLRYDAEMPSNPIFSFLKDPNLTQERRLQLLRVLLQAGAQLNINYSDEPLKYIIEVEDRESEALLREHGAYITVEKMQKNYDRKIDELLNTLRTKKTPYQERLERAIPVLESLSFADELFETLRGKIVGRCSSEILLGLDGRDLSIEIVQSAFTSLSLGLKPEVVSEGPNSAALIEMYHCLDIARKDLVFLVSASDLLGNS